MTNQKALIHFQKDLRNMKVHCIELLRKFEKNSYILDNSNRIGCGAHMKMLQSKYNLAWDKAIQMNDKLCEAIYELHDWVLELESQVKTTETTGTKSFTYNSGKFKTTKRKYIRKR